MTDANQIQIHRIMVGDRLTPLQVELWRDGAAVDLTGAGVTFRMVRLGDGSVKVSDQNATIVTAASGLVQYAFAAADVDEPGEFAAYFLVTSGSSRESFPHDGQRLLVRVIAF